MSLDYTVANRAVTLKWLRLALTEQLGSDVSDKMPQHDWHDESTAISPQLLDKIAKEWNSHLSVSKFVRAYTAPGTYEFTVPPGVRSITVDAVAGGGGGGSGNMGGGGSSGMGVKGKRIDVTPGQVLKITIGSGGAVNANGGNTVISVE